MTGRTLLHYTIVEKLGEGGMGVVWKARDNHLDRFMAIKVLPADKVVDGERMRRFVQEAKAASALNHPNIVHIYDVTETEGVPFIAMEYVVGKTLDQLIGRKGLRLNETLKYAVQIADALARAHSAGIVHRDLKPSNIMVDEHSLVKVLDFGLAKLTERVSGDLGATQTIQSDEKPGTAEGTIIGTVAYMSPEQAEGREVDARSDTFSFGALLYEMVTGRRAFQRESKLSTLSAVLKEEPAAVGSIKPELPHDLETIINRCLRKDPNRRFQHMADVKIALEDLKEQSDSGSLTSTVQHGPVRPRRSVLIWLAAAILTVGCAVGLWLLRRLAAPREVPPRLVPLTTYPGVASAPSFSPDGNQVAFSWNGEKQDNFDIYVKLIDSDTPLRLTTDPALDFHPAWSPDGRSIAFERLLSDNSAAVILIPAIGGPEREVGKIYAGISNWGTDPRPKIAWSLDGKWLGVADKSSPEQPFALFLLSPTSGEKRRLTLPLPKTAGDSDPAFSPDGRTLAFIRSPDEYHAEIHSLSLSQDLSPRGEPRQLTNEHTSITSPVWTRDGREILYATGQVFIPNLYRIAASGGVGEQIAMAGEGISPAISNQGNRLAYVRPVVDTNIWRVQIHSAEAGKPRATPCISSSRLDQSAQYSPDGKRIAFESDRSGNLEIWVSDDQGSHAVQVTSFGKGESGTPRWSPDGRRIAFDSNAPGGNFDIYTVNPSGGNPQRMTADPAGSAIPSYSRNGKWLYFASTRTGRDEIWKMPSEGGAAVQVTRNGGVVAFESVDGKWLYYLRSEGSQSLWKMSTAGGEETQLGPVVQWRAFTVTDNGIYFIAPPKAGNTGSIDFLSFSSSAPKTLLPLVRKPFLGLSASPDNKSLLYTQFDQSGSNLMLIENFR